jgi:tRNA(fMet)-specific endonuclease VapC
MPALYLGRWRFGGYGRDAAEIHRYAESGRQSRSCASVGLCAVITNHRVGAAASRRRKANEGKIALFLASGDIALLPFEAADAVEAAEIRAQLKRTARPIGLYDVLIAAQARRAGTALVTANTREFSRVPGLIVVDWAA